MTTKPSYEELEKKIRDLEHENSELKAIQKKESRHREAEHLAQLGHWELDLVSNSLIWSEEIYRIFDLDPREFGATYEAFLDTVHPDDRNFVDRSYTDSVKNKTGYDIAHRLLLRDGTVKYVNEKCQTMYDDEGKPLRSIGTVQDITNQKQEEYGFSGIVGKNFKMRKLFETIREAAEHNIAVFIQGESGTGKELVALAIHNEGPRAKKPFVPVNCGALPEGVLESELFGHEKGAFTGAIQERKGRFELANGGTLFLDEITDMPKSVQVKILRVLQDGKFERVGGEETISTDVRIISAANRDLKGEVKKGRFRQDLYYRICVMPMNLPPLKDRKEDIPLLVDHFLEKSAGQGREKWAISKDSLAVIIAYAWPGNIRELQSALQYACIKSKGNEIMPHHLPPELDEFKSGIKRTRASEKHTPGRPRKLDFESVAGALKETGGNKAKAARLLGVGRATIYNFILEHPEVLNNKV